MKTVEHKSELCVVGGGMAGLCCAVAAARHGIKVILVQDRSVLGGNASDFCRLKRTAVINSTYLALK